MRRRSGGPIVAHRRAAGLLALGDLRTVTRRPMGGRYPWVEDLIESHPWLGT